MSVKVYADFIYSRQAELISLNLVDKMYKSIEQYRLGSSVYSIYVYGSNLFQQT
ncbi:hypothetical protein [Eubacterium ramulus]|uniref:hypothetical protein n=1 Tax=Eubacterium ramulus TaxID=39490 RepID=UPI00399ABCE8